MLKIEKESTTVPFQVKEEIVYLKSLTDRKKKKMIKEGIKPLTDN